MAAAIEFIQSTTFAVSASPIFSFNDAVDVTNSKLSKRPPAEGFWGTNEVIKPPALSFFLALHQW